jgi:uncharacterized membrane protein
MIIYVFVFVFMGCLFIGFAIPLILRKVPPNIWYGFRFPKTVNNPKVWYPANHYSGKLLLYAGILTIGLSMICASLPGITPERYAVLVSILLIGIIAVVLFFSILYVNSIDRSDGN